MRRFFTGSGPELVEPGIVPAHRRRPDQVDADPERTADREYPDRLDPLDRTRYPDTDDVTDADSNVRTAIAGEP